MYVYVPLCVRVHVFVCVPVVFLLVRVTVPV